MKKILILGDIHANYPALKAIQNHVQGCRFDMIINTGDTIVYNTFPNETIKWFRKKEKSASILGNTDKRILRILKGKKLKKPVKEEKRVMYFWTSINLLPKNIKYLQLLPRHADFTLDNVRIGVFHGTLDDENETLFADSPEKRFRELAEGSPYQIQIMGHSHTPYYKKINTVHFINPGSAGRMFDGDPRASFAILKISLGKINVEHFRIPYPVEEVITGLKKNRLPDIYQEMFRAGKKLN
ncbi:MAG: metallophosphoesterase family protein [Desulfobacula sp.]|nr:metallophosphoesterase family protein [Desulfobacula sp.]